MRRRSAKGARFSLWLVFGAAGLSAGACATAENEALPDTTAIGGRGLSGAAPTSGATGSGLSGTVGVGAGTPSFAGTTASAGAGAFNIGGAAAASGAAGLAGGAGSLGGGTGQTVFETGVCAPSPALSLKYKQGSSNPKQITAQYQFSNETDTPVALSQLKIWYLFSNEETSGWSTAIYDAKIEGGSGGYRAIAGSSLRVVPLVPPMPGADSYIELSFTSALTIEKGATATVNWDLQPQSYNAPDQVQTDDYSYNAAAGQFVTWDHVLIYRAADLVSGCLPKTANGGGGSSGSGGAPSFAGAGGRAGSAGNGGTSGSSAGGGGAAGHASGSGGTNQGGTSAAGVSGGGATSLGGSGGAGAP